MTRDEVKTLVTDSMSTVLKAQLPEHLKDQITPDAIRQIVADELAKMGTDSKALTPDQVKALTEATAKAAMDNLRREKKGVFDPQDAKQDKQMIEIGYQSRKFTNLTLHEKQLVNIIMRRDPNTGIDAKALEIGQKHTDRFHARLAVQGCKALTSTGAGTGDEFVPHDLSAELQRRFYLASLVAQMILAREIAQPTEPYSLPLSTTRPFFRINTTENTTQEASDPGTGVVTLATKRMACKVVFSYEVDEDSIIAILPWVQEQIALAAVEAYEDALMNGDTTGTHMDSDTHAVSNHPAKAWKGFRKLALTVSALKVDLATGGLTAANCRALIKALGKYAIDKNNLMWLAGVKAYTDMLGIAEVLTIDKFGPRATIHTGQLANLYGIPIIPSAAVREDLNASGVYDATTMTKGSLLLVNLSGFIAGRRREFMLETDRDIDKMQTIVVASFRRSFTPIEVPSASISTVAVGYNYTA